MTRVTKVFPSWWNPEMEGRFHSHVWSKFCKTFFQTMIRSPLIKRWPIDTWSGFDLLANRPTRAQTFVACLSFVAELLGWKEAEDASHSQRALWELHIWVSYGSECSDRLHLRTWLPLWCLNYAAYSSKTTFCRGVQVFAFVLFMEGCEWVTATGWVTNTSNRTLEK